MTIIDFYQQLIFVRYKKITLITLLLLSAFFKLSAQETYPDCPVEPRPEAIGTYPWIPSLSTPVDDETHKIREVVMTPLFNKHEITFSAIIPKTDIKGQKIVPFLTTKPHGSLGSPIKYEMKLCDSSENRYGVTADSERIGHNINSVIEWDIVGVNRYGEVTRYSVGDFLEMYLDVSESDSARLITDGLYTATGPSVLDTFPMRHSSLYPTPLPKPMTKTMNLQISLTDEVFKNSGYPKPGDVVACFFRTKGGKYTVDFGGSDTIVVEDTIIDITLWGNPDTTGLKHKLGFNDGDEIYLYKWSQDNPTYFTTLGVKGLYHTQNYHSSLSLSGNGKAIVKHEDYPFYETYCDCGYPEHSVADAAVPEIESGTDFGTSTIPVTHTFYIKNTGFAPMEVYSISVSDTVNFSTEALPDTMHIAEGDSVPFTVTFLPQIHKPILSPVCNAEVNIVSNAAYTNEHFTVKGTVSLDAELTITETVCDSLVYNGVIYDSTGIYRDTLQKVQGGDSTVVLNVIVNKLKQTLLAESVPFGGSIEFGNRILHTAGSYVDSLHTATGCDSIVTLQLSIEPYRNDIYRKLCGGTYNFAGQTLTQSGTYTDSLIAQSGADSIITLHLTIYPVQHYTVYDTVTISYTESYTFGTQTITQSGDYAEIFAASTACDSTVYLHVKQQTDIRAYICGNKAYRFNGKEISETGYYIDSLRNSDGGDSVVALSLTVVAVDTVSGPELTMEYGSDVMGMTVTYSGEYGYFHEGSCNYLIIPISAFPKSETIDTTVCTSFDFGGRSIMETGIYTDTLQDINGIDSLVQTLNVTVKEDCNEVVQRLQLFKGWNLVSLYVQPSNNFTGSVFPHAVQVKNQGYMWNKNYPEYLNSLTQINQGAGYLVFNSLDETITIKGNTQTISETGLQKGWNMIGVPHNAEFSVADLPLETELIKDFDNFLKPSQSGLLEKLVPGNAYYIKVNTNCKLEW